MSKARDAPPKISKLPLRCTVNPPSQPTPSISPNRPTITKPSTLPIPHNIPRPGRDTRFRLEDIIKRTAPIALARIPREVITRPGGILREADAARGPGALVAALGGVGDGVDAVDVDAVVAGVAGLVDALVAVGGADDVVGLALGVSGGRGRFDGLGVCRRDGLGGGRCRRRRCCGCCGGGCKGGGAGYGLGGCERGGGLVGGRYG